MFLAAVLEGIRAGMVVVDRDFRVKAWNHRAQDLWGLRADEVEGHPLTTLDIGLPADELITPIRSALSGASTTVEVKGHVAPGQGDALPDPRARRSGRTTAR